MAPFANWSGSARAEFLQVLSNLRPYLVQCYDRQDFPRTNNEMERSIRGLKTRYRRGSSRKNWNVYLLRYGRCVAYYEWWEQDATRRQQLVELASRLDRARWRELRREKTVAQHEQLTRFRYRQGKECGGAAAAQRCSPAFFALTVFLALASGSLTSTVPLLRTRMALPVSHQVRSSCQV